MTFGAERTNLTVIAFCEKRAKQGTRGILSSVLILFHSY